MSFQTYSDTLLERTLLPFIPRAISPNMVSWLRIISLPFIWYFLAKGEYVPGLCLFAVAALTDALDGAMARKRDKVTEAGKILDAVADRGLILLVAFFFIPLYFGWPLLVAMIVLECVNGLAAYRSKRKIGLNPGANWAGKIKMIIQCAAFGILFFAILTRAASWFSVAQYLLWLSLVFAFLQAFSYPTRKNQL